MALLLIQSDIFGQIESASVLRKGSYLDDPTSYLSKVEANLIPSNILIDKIHFSNLILNVNGRNKVTTVAANDWAKLYNQLRYANYDTTYINNIGLVKEIVDIHYKQSQTYSIGIIDVEFQKIKQTALDRGELIETESTLDVRRASSNSFSTHRAVVASCLSHNIYGDRINFLVSDLFFVSNQRKQQLKAIEIDFGNGEGYKRVTRNETISIDYSSSSEYIEIKTKLTYEDVTNRRTNTYYSRSSVFRKGSSTVPLPSVTGNSSAGRVNDDIPRVQPIYYGKETFEIRRVCSPCPAGSGTIACCTNVPFPVTENKLEVHILLSPQNSSGKLRRPFILTDGFDPGNKRDYYSNNIDIEKDLPRSNDERGLYQLLNGDPSPWYADRETTPNVIAALRADGYDIVFINFFDGAGNIQENAKVLRRFFNEKLNSSEYRDNKTEEAILVGPSMGGIITRHMLKSMEDANEEHYVKTWISFDSPQQGANIPIGLQRAIQDLNGKKLIPKDSKEPLKEALSTVNMTAARQLLLYHYTESGSKATPEHSQLYRELDALGYPSLSKNYTITNGGKTKLYPTDGQQIVNFEAGVSNLVAAGVATVSRVFGPIGTIAGGIFAANADRIVSTSANARRNIGNEIAYDNAPGGWNAALYEFNLNGDNNVDIKETNIPYNWATFMPTTSAFGIKVTQGNIAKSWEDYDPNDTPFDEIRGMQENEEHVKISKATKDYLIEELRADFDNTVRPRVRGGSVLSQKLRGKRAFTSGKTMILGGSDNNLTLESGADVIASAGQSIVLSPGFTAHTGTNFVAKIENIDYSTVLRVADLTTEYIDYTQPSPYTGLVYSYYDNSKVSTTAPDPFEMIVYPNPLKDLMSLKLSGLGETYASLQISNAVGQVVYRSSRLVNGVNTINLESIHPGVYYIRVTYNGSNTSTYKVIKL